MTEAEQREAGAWQYPGEYALYNLPPNVTLTQRGCRPGEKAPETSFLAFAEDGALVGYVRSSVSHGECELGVGVRPDACGRGIGTQMLRLACAEIRRRQPRLPIGLNVRIWNARAIACYEKVGFRQQGDSFVRTTSLGEGEFIHMVLLSEE